MKKSADKMYESIVSDFLKRMEKVDAPAEDFIAALEDAISEIEMEISAAKLEEGT
jgi:copper oxidase (laccase) domain-containing protein